MKIFFDTEFTGLHKDTTLISLGCITEEGKTFYAECIDFDKSQCDDWINKNVLSNLKYYNNHPIPYMIPNEKKYVVYGTIDTVAESFKDWLNIINPERKYQIEFVADVAHYDFVLLIDLFGDAFALQKYNISAVCHDINQDIARYYNISDTEAFDKSREFIVANLLPDDIDKHNALFDARIARLIYYKINGYHSNMIDTNL